MEKVINITVTLQTYKYLPRLGKIIYIIKRTQTSYCTRELLPATATRELLQKRKFKRPASRVQETAVLSRATQGLSQTNF